MRDHVTVPSVSPSHVGLCTPDLPATLRFFTEGLGFEAAGGWDLDSNSLPGLPAALETDGEVVVRSQLVRHGDFAVELLGFDRPEPTGSPSASRSQVGLTHLAFWVDDLERAVERAVAGGATVVEGTRADLGVPLVFLVDPAGVRIELMERPG